MSCEHNKAMQCNCTFSCPRHGQCCECIAYHGRAGEFPACFFSEKGEKTGDRSFAMLKKERDK